MKKYLKQVLVAVFVSTSSFLFANEGMWIPLLLEKLNEKEMKSLGMKISAKDIYNVNSGSLKDAIVSFGGFCTAEIISTKGLVLTNHHCGFDAIQNHSTLDHNYIRDGFWSGNNGEEIPNPDLFATFIVRIEDVSKQVMYGVLSSMNEAERQSAVDKNIYELRKNFKKEAYQDILIRPFFEGNQYYLFITETYRDVRLVGAPPSSVGNFGKDTDNWMWPRHTGDFSMFRIYAGKDNKPAGYSPENIPYKPKRYLSISLDGVKDGDFTMVFGFPGRTTEYLPSIAVEQIVTVNNPAKIRIREKALSVIDNYMRRNEQIKIQYASKYAGIQNAYKKWQGEVLGILRTNAIAKKKVFEAEFQKRVNANPVWKEEYGTLLNDLENAYAQVKPFGLARDYFTEIVSKVELFAIGAQLNSLITAYEKEGDNGYRQRISQVKENLEGLFNEYNSEVDQKLFETLMEMYINDQEPAYISPVFKEKSDKKDGFEKVAKKIYDETELDDRTAVFKLLDDSPSKVVGELKKEDAIRLYNDLSKTYSGQIQSKLNEIQTRINQLQRAYMKAQMEVFKEKKFYPDANSTLRVTYGQVRGYSARDAVKFDYYTYLDGVMEKYIPGDYEFDVPAKLIDLYKNKDYGQYAMNGKVPVCFIAANHTTGGNSGSPALDAYGNLLGLNFDRVWEGTMSDINYDPSVCRNIMVDIRYVLFLVDKLAGARHLINEMKLVHPRKKI